MSRPISEDDLHAFVDGALSDSRRAEVEAYLESNPEVAERYAQFGVQREALRAAFDPIAAEPVPPNLNLHHLVATRHRPTRPAWQGAAAACLLLLAGGSSGWMLRGIGMEQTTGIDAVAQEASYAYAVFGSDSGRPVEIAATESDALLGWVETRLSEPVSLPDLSGAGYRFIGGRVVATRNGPAGLLMYDDAEGTRIAIMMRPMVRRDENAPMAKHREGDVVGYAWADDGMGYSLVGGLDVADVLHPIADEARRQLLAST
ncbi:anti-sigma factor family protein [Alteriqipengyuania lutimaris]|uniref:Anti-sigma factor n=1 Tax=Alteriqipengyuania lutimaris TaxID=1538146 RepID=A0A395LJS3_9SPHN|nr:anti-sigma factor [Alteriqipengyuania lutimaris]MBB3035084.1 anti-sigma factor RsiW [Alteriqipengyuania lutimaris]RDS75704.1 anti-sigma factor [Alteriqipengyuania lutimaris]